jgi:hypothetical protein
VWEKKGLTAPALLDRRYTVNHPRYHSGTKLIDMSDKGLFTGHEVWKGGHYELFIRPSADSNEGVCSILKALWSFPSLDGCYLRRDCEPSPH